MPPLNPFPPLAVELVRAILEDAARTDAQSAYALSLVSRAVHVWTKPIMYHTIILRTTSHVQMFYHSLWRAALRRLGSLVHRIYFGLLGDDPGPVPELLGHCPHLEWLVTETEYFDRTDFLSEIVPEHPKPWLLIRYYATMSLPPPNHEFMSNITHLHVELLHAPNIDAVLALHGLTHLSVGAWGESGTGDFVELVRRVLKSPLPLVIVLVQAAADEGRPSYILQGDPWYELAQVEDSRLYVKPAFIEADLPDLVRRGRTLWDNAENKYKDWRRLVQWSNFEGPRRTSGSEDSDEEY